MRNRPLRIAIIGSSSHPIAQPFAGGLEAHIWHLTRALADAGHHITLFAGEGTDVGADTRVLLAEAFRPSAWAQADVSMPPEAVLREHHAYLSLMLKLAAHPERYDIVHNHSLHYLPLAMAPALPIPMVTTLHTPPTPWLESAITIAEGARCVAVSRHTARSWGHVVDRVPVIHNGVRLRNWPEGLGGRNLVWFGRFVPEKGAHLAIQAARIAGLDLRMAGPISDHDYFSTMVAPHLDNQIRYLGHLDQDALARLVGSSMATLVTPMWDEPYGLVVAESLACGTPVASFDRGGIPEIVGDDAGILVPAGDVGALAAAAVNLGHLDRSDVRARALAHCCEDSMVARYQQLYYELVNGQNLAEDMSA